MRIGTLNLKQLRIVIMIGLMIIVGFTGPIAIFVGWYTLLHFGLGFTKYFRKSPLRRFIFCDIPFFISCGVLIWMNIGMAKADVPEAGIIYLFPLMGYVPFSIYYLAFTLILGLIVEIVHELSNPKDKKRHTV